MLNVGLVLAQGEIANRLSRAGVITDFFTQTSSHCGELTAAWDSANNRFVGYASKLAGLQIVHATSTNGLNWTVTGTHVVGDGNGGEAGEAVRPYIYTEGGTQYLFYSDYISPPGGNLKVRTATNWTTFTAPATTTDQGNPSSAGVIFEANETDWYANVRIYKDGATYRMLLERTGASTSHTYYATASNILGPWTIQNGGERLHTPSIDGIVSYSGSVSPGAFFKVGSFWYWFPWLSSTLAYGDDHTRVYFTKSTDLITWTPPRLIRDIEPTDAIGAETLDQFADVNMLEVDGDVYMWTTVVTDTASFSYLHKFDGTVAQLGHFPPNDEYPEIEAYPDAHKTLNVGSYTDMEFDSIVKATHGSFDGATFIVPEGAAGRYSISVQGGQVLNGTTQGLHIRANVDGSQELYNFSNDPVTGGAGMVCLQGELRLAVGQQLKIQVYQGSGLAWEAQGGNKSLWRLNIRRIQTNQ